MLFGDMFHSTLYSTVWPFLVLEYSRISDINNFGCKSEEKKHHFDINGTLWVVEHCYINMYLSVC